MLADITVEFSFRDWHRQSVNYRSFASDGGGCFHANDLKRAAYPKKRTLDRRVRISTRLGDASGREIPT